MFVCFKLSSRLLRCRCPPPTPLSQPFLMCQHCSRCMYVLHLKIYELPPINVPHSSPLYNTPPGQGLQRKLLPPYPFPHAHSLPHPARIIGNGCQAKRGMLVCVPWENERYQYLNFQVQLANGFKVELHGCFLHPQSIQLFRQLLHFCLAIQPLRLQTSRSRVCAKVLNVFKVGFYILQLYCKHVLEPY